MPVSVRGERAWLAVVGIGEDGWDGLGLEARRTIERADLIVGSSRQLGLIVETPAERMVWPSPMLPFIDEILTRHRARHVVILASGDPMLYGVGAVFARRVDPQEIRVLPHVSAFALACARMGWPGVETALVSAVGRALERVHPYVQPGLRLVVLAEDANTPAALAALLVQRGYGTSTLSVLEHLGGPDEHRRDGTAATWTTDPGADLNVIAVTCIADEHTRPLAAIPGLPDDAFENDGALTKREVRAATLARLVPLARQLLWDVGAGSGAIAIEWMRTHPSCRAVAFERREDRTRRIARNAKQLGVPDLRIVTAEAPAALEGHEQPDAIFIGGGVGTKLLVETCWEALPRGGRLVANAVTVEGEVLLAGWQGTLGGELVRIAVSHAEPIGSFLTWRPHLPITQWAAIKP